MGQYISSCGGCGKGLLNAKYTWSRQCIFIRWDKGKKWTVEACSLKCASKIDKKLKEEEWNA